MAPSHKPDIVFIGLGYVGLSTSACFASRGFRVHGIDVDEKRVKTLRQGLSPIHEEGLETLLRASIKKGTLEPSTSFEGIRKSRTIFITVGTPSREDGSLDTTYLEAASKEVGRQLAKNRGYRLVVVKSTVLPGTTEGLVRPILEKESGRSVGEEIGLASNPEFLHEGSAIRETLHPEAIVIGGTDRRSSSALTRVYEAFYRSMPPTILTTPSNAEMMKYAINAGRAAQVSFINTVANLCGRIPGCDYDEVRKGLAMVAKMDQRYLAAGLGFGGSCLPKDLRALGAALRAKGAGDEVVETALKVNAGQVREALALAEKLCGSLEGRRVAVLGLAFKPGTDDIRESVSISLVRALLRKGSEVTVFDPVAMESTRAILGSQVTYAKSARECIRGAQCAIVATGWDAFRRLGPGDFKRLMASPAVVDGRRIYSQEAFRRGGVIIATVGTGPSLSGKMGSRKELPSKERWEYVYSDRGIKVGGNYTGLA